MNVNLRQFAAAVLVVIAMMFSSATALSPKREMRSAWFTTVWGIDWPSTQGATSSAQTKQKAEMIEYLDGFANTNMNGSCFQVRSMGDAMYPSKYAPWSSYLTGTRGKDPGWDPLAYFVEESHKRGLEAYVWLNPYRWATSTSGWSTSMDQEWKNSGMIIAGTSNSGYQTFNPALPETRQLIVNVVNEILDNYAVDGILFDDYFYPSGGTAETSSAPDYEDYKASGTTMSIGDWRRANVNQMVKDVYEAIQAKRPDVRFGISPAGVAGTSSYSKYGLPSPSSYGIKASDWQYAQIYSDPLAWLKEGTIDFISPQMYWPTTHSTAPYEPLAKWWSYVGNYYGRHFYASQESADLGEDGELSNNTSGWSELANQTALTRQHNQNNAPGIIYYSASYINGPEKTGFGDYMKANSFTHKSLTPVVTWKTKTNYGKVANLTSTGSSLSWAAVSNGNAIIRYTVYAIPSSVTLADAQLADGDGISNEYLLGVSYSGSYSVPTDKQGDFYYAVCVYDGYGNEFEPAVVGYPEGESAKVTLTFPINNSVVEWVADFKWSAVSGATYALEVSDNSNFTNILIQNKGLTANSESVDLGALEESKTYYWRVSSTESGKLPAMSEVATFKTPTRPSAPAVALTSPANGASFDADFTFKWNGVDVDSYELQVSSSNDFATIKYKQEIAAGASTVSVPMTISLLGKGTFYWRVLSKDSHMKTSASEARSFEITKIVVGSFEPGYSVKLDKDSYAQVGDMSFTSLWFRSVMGDYDNITFDNDGSFNRGFCAVGDYVYIAGRTDNDSEATTYLRKMDGKTGEIVSDIVLGEESKMSYFPCNDVVKDSKGNVCISNLTLNVGSTPLVIHLVDLETGALTQVASLSKSGLSSSRVDHVSIIGDVVAGDFTVFAAVSKSNTILRWTFEDGEETGSTSCTLKSFYPTTVTTLGIAPFVIPVTENDIFVAGGDIHLTRYNFSTGRIVDSFANNTALTPEGFEVNGGTYLTLNDQNYLIYPCTDYNTTGHAYNLTKVNSNYDFSSMELMWNFPKGSIGSVNSTTYQAEVDYVLGQNGNAWVYVYVPGNGVAAYELVDTSASGIGNVISQDITACVNGSVLSLGKVVDGVAVYSVYGMKIGGGVNVSAVELNVAPGIYVVEITENSNVITKKIVVK